MGRDRKHAHARKRGFSLGVMRVATAHALRITGGHLEMTPAMTLSLNMNRSKCGAMQVTIEVNANQKKKLARSDAIG